MRVARSLPARAAVLALVFLAFAHRAPAGDTHQILTFEKDKLTITKNAGFDVVAYEGLELSREVSSPQLPVKLLHLALPPGKTIAAISIDHLESEELAGSYDIFPVQAPQILSLPEVRFTRPGTAVYSSSTPFPPEVVTVGPRGFYSGYNVGALLVSPVQYVPSQKKLIFHAKIGVSITYRDIDKAPVPRRGSAYSDAARRGPLTGLVENPRALELPGIQQIAGSSALPVEDHLYVIITADGLAPAFDPLRYWKNKKGLSAKIVTTSWIYANYTGPDDAARLREFIKDAYQNWGTVWVLLGGDTGIIPERPAYAMDCELGLSYLNDIPCDLYYSDLDGDWNADGDTLYGEVDDDVDMLPDVFVGRAPVENPEEAAAFVYKVLAYEMYPPNGHELDVLFMSEILWEDPYTDSGAAKNLIDSLYVPDRFDPLTKLYESLGNENFNNVMSALNAGQNLINHTGHAWLNVLGIGDGYLRIADVDALTNSPRFSILFSIGCWPAAIDYDCIAEHFLSNPNGGGVAFIGNSRYGWGSPGNPTFGYSDRFDQKFYQSLFEDGIFQLGAALAAAKAAYVAYAGQENVYRWCEYELNLLGDPEMPVWTDTPRPLSVSAPAELPAGTGACPVVVTDGAGPVAGALVCLMQSGGVYETGITGGNGQVTLDVAAAGVSPISITVSARNFIPYQGVISIVSSEPQVGVRSYFTNGSAEGYVYPGDPVNVGACFKNYGSEPAVGTSAVLTNPGSKITLVDSTEYLGDIPPGDSVNVASTFSFLAGTDLVNGEVVFLTASISDTSETTWTSPITITAAAPVVSFYGYTASDYQFGDRDGFVEPGETVSVAVTLFNSGLYTAQDVTVAVGCPDADVSVLTPDLWFGNIPPSGSKTARTDVAVTGSCPSPSFPQINLSVDTQQGAHFDDDFLLSVGEIGFLDDMEGGSGSWTHGGTIDLWHLTSNRVFSGDSSWYCGIGGGAYIYVNNMSAVLELEPVALGREARLSFRCWYEFTTYGTDGVYVEVNGGAGWNTLDYIGSGGALGALNTGNDWLPYTYDLSAYPAGTPLSLRFRFVSDEADVAEGVYIDDVTIMGGEWPDKPPAPIPALSGWALAALVLVLAAAGAFVLRRLPD